MGNWPCPHFPMPQPKVPPGSFTLYDLPCNFRKARRCTRTGEVCVRKGCHALKLCAEDLAKAKLNSPKEVEND
jgi:hypothetical protein